MNSLKIKKNDTVVILSGKDKGKKGKVLAAQPKAGKVIVAGVNVASKHRKPRNQQDEGGIIKMETPIYACKVQLVCPKCGKALFKKKGGKLVCMTAGCGYEKSAGKKKSNE